MRCWDLPHGSDSKESACSAEDPGLIPGSGRSPEKGMTTHSSILAWRISWTKKPGGLQSIGCKGSDTTEQLTHFQSLFGNSKKLQFEHAIYGKPQACSETKERESAFMGKMGKLQGMF